MSSSHSDEANLATAHRHSIYHREEILASELCGCFYCGETFRPAEIEEWVDQKEGIGTTAICPRCGIDSVIGSRSGFPLTPEFLQQMYNHWFGRSYRMMSVDEFNRLSAGEFVSVKLAGGPTVEGYAARDPDDLHRLRVDGLALEDDGSVSQFSLRLEQSEIEAVAVLSNAPEVTDSQGKDYRMQAALWAKQGETS